MTVASGTVRLEVEGAVATVTIDNSPVNALDDAALAALGEAAREIAERDDIRAAILTGSGRLFAAGADLAELRESLGRPNGLDEHLAITRPVFEAWRAIAAPTIAAVNGDAVGGGLELALGCDLIVAESHVRLGLPEVKLGLMPGGGGTQRLARRIGGPAALKLILLGSVVDAPVAQRLGLVDKLSGEGAALSDATALARRLAALPKLAVQAVKRAVRETTEAGLSAGLDRERELFLSVAGSADAAEGAAAFLDKRRPRFEHR